MRPTIVIAGMLVVFATFACNGDHSYAYNGSWLGHRTLTPKPGTDQNVVDEVSRVMVTFRDDGTFTMSDAGIKKDGRFDLAGGHAVLNVEKILDKPISRESEDVQKRNVPVTVTPIDANTVKFFDPAGFDADGLVLTRIKKDSKAP